MKLSELPIADINGNIIKRIDGTISQVFEYFPNDFKQLDHLDGESYVLKLKNLLLSKTSNNFQAEQRTSLFQRIKNPKKFNSIKFYQLEGRYYYESENDLSILNSIPAVNSFDYFLSGNDDFYSDVIFGEDFFKINGTYFRLVNCYDFPDTFNPFAFSNLGDQIISFNRMSQDQAISHLKNNRKLHVGNLGKGIRDLESEKAYGESETLLEEILSGEEGLFDVEMWFIIKSSTEDELNSKTLELLASLKAINATPLIESKLSFGVIVPGLFFGVPTLFKRSHQLTATYLTMLLPLDRDFLQEDGLQLWSRTGWPLYFDNFDLNAENFNVAITGPTGVGKSVFAQKIVDHARIKERSVVIIDKGGSFSKYLDYYGGNIFSMQFNPMEFKDPLFLKEFILVFIPDLEITTKEKGKLFVEIQSALNNGVSTFQELIEFLESKIPEISYYFSEIWPYITNDLS